MEESSVAELPELLVVLGMYASHSFDHLFAEFHGRRQRLRIAAEDVAEVDVKELARSGQHQVVQMAVADAQQVGNDAVTSFKFRD